MLKDFTYNKKGAIELGESLVIEAAPNWDWESLRLALYSESKILESETQIVCLHEEKLEAKTLYFIRINFYHPIQEVCHRVKRASMMVTAPYETIMEPILKSWRGFKEIDPNFVRKYYPKFKGHGEFLD